VVVGVENSCDPESYAGGSVAAGRASMAERSRGRSQTKRDTLVLQVGVGRETNSAHRKNQILRKPDN
jgi:hypothetical protein